MKPECNTLYDFLQVTEAAAVSAARFIGSGDKIAADESAVQSMRNSLNALPYRSRIVIGEGELDNAPMLYLDEEFGEANTEIAYDLAVDPLEGTNLCARGEANSMTVLAAGVKGSVFRGPDILMDKIACAMQGVVDLDKSPTENILALAASKNMAPKDLCIAILDRDRHQKIIEEIRACGAKLKLLSDNDIVPAICSCMENSRVDLLLGKGGSPEGVLTAAAIKCLGGHFQGRLYPENEEEMFRCQQIGIVDVNKKLGLNELFSGEVAFACTGVTSGDLLDGVSVHPSYITTHSLVMQSHPRTTRWIISKKYKGL
ncbi:MAG: class II fructose-bisphosphatase [Chitinophagales bacterium]|nr:class II fructose-bisphosphatase [Chitinophagales bacterium]